MTSNVSIVSDFVANGHQIILQILAGLITYLLLAIYCHEQHQEKVSIKRVRELRIQIQNEARTTEHLHRKKQSPSNNQFLISAKT
jgi:hypothetical protein